MYVALYDAENLHVQHTRCQQVSVVLSRMRFATQTTGEVVRGQGPFRWRNWWAASRASLTSWTGGVAHCDQRYETLTGYRSIHLLPSNPLHKFLSAMAAKLETWALPRLQQLLPLDDESLRQIITYADSLPKDSAAEHLKNLLGDDAKSLEFISSFNMRRQHAPSSSSATREPASSNAPAVDAARQPKKPARKKPNIHALPARQVQGHGDLSGAYRKRDEERYLVGSSRQTHRDQVADNLALQDKPRDAAQLPLITDNAAPKTQPVTSKPPPSASGHLISDSLAPSKNSSRKSSPAPKTKVNISGGTAMHGASTALSDLDSAIRSLEIQTNPSLMGAEDDARRKCPCMATRHPLLDMAPNCLNCGKIICVKEGLGPCTFCKSPLLSSDELHKMLRVLKDERGEERMKSNNAAHKRAEVSQGKVIVDRLLPFQSCVH